MIEREELALASRVGLVAACAAFVEVVAYAVSLAVPGDGGFAFLISVLLTPTLIVLFVSLHYTVPLYKRLWTHLSLCFAVLYAGMCGVAYFLQLAFVRLNPLAAGPETIRLYDFIPGSAVYAQDVLGFFFLCLAAMAVAPALPVGPGQQWLRRLLIAHGACALVPIVFALVRLPDSLTSASGRAVAHIGNLGWCLFFSPIAALLAIYFRGLMPQPASVPGITPAPAPAARLEPSVGFQERWVTTLRGGETIAQQPSVGTPVFRPPDAETSTGAVFPDPAAAVNPPAHELESDT